MKGPFQGKQMNVLSTQRELTLKRPRNSFMEDQGSVFTTGCTRPSFEGSNGQLKRENECLRS